MLKTELRGDPIGSHAGMFGCDGRRVDVIALNQAPARKTTGFFFLCKNAKIAWETVQLLRRKLYSNMAAAKALRRNNAYPLAIAFVSAVLGTPMRDVTGLPDPEEQLRARPYHPQSGNVTRKPRQHRPKH